MANELNAELSFPEVSASVLPLLTTNQRIADLVKRKVDDQAYGFDEIVAILFQGLIDIAGHPGVLLPELETTVDITTDPNVNYCQLPANYHRNLTHCHSISYNRPVKVYGSVVQLYRHHSNLDQTGYVWGVAPKGRRLYYQRVPSSAETLRITFYRYPERKELLDQKPTCLPPHLAEKLLVNYALKEIYDEIEDALEGPKPNTTLYEGRYEKQLAKLIAFLGPESRLPQEIADEIHWDELFT